MFEFVAIAVLSVLSLIFWITPFLVNAFYQRRALRHLDEFLIEKTDEFNRQIKTNAVIVLVRRSLWGLFFLSGMIWNFRAVYGQGFRWLTAFVVLTGLACFAFGIWGFRAELKRLKALS